MGRIQFKHVNYVVDHFCHANQSDTKTAAIKFSVSDMVGAPLSTNCIISQFYMFLSALHGLSSLCYYKSKNCSLETESLIYMN